MRAGLTPDFNDIEWGTDDYSDGSGDITIAAERSVSERVPFGSDFLETYPAQNSAIGRIVVRCRSTTEYLLGHYPWDKRGSNEQRLALQLARPPFW